MPISTSSFPVVDVFAGPGGLGEGFRQFDYRGRRPFKVRLSIEKDPVACATLKLRKFFHQFQEPPPEYGAFIRGEVTADELYRAFPRQAAQADANTWQAELGKVAPLAVASRVKSALKGAKHWILLGGPPCQAYSVVGRVRMRSHKNFENDERHFLYREYLRIVADHHPSAFVFENVKGLLSSTRSGKRVFAKILSDLESPAKALKLRAHNSLSYRLHALGPSAGVVPSATPDFLVLTEQHGVPQCRHRIVIVGIRSDIRGTPHPLELQSTVDAGRVLDDLPPIRSRLSQEADSLSAWQEALREITRQTWARSNGHAVLSPVVKEINRVIRMQGSMSMGPGGLYQTYSRMPSTLADWYRRGAVGLSLHETRQHRRDDLHRYLFAASFLRVHGRSPLIKDFPTELQPDHKNVDLAVTGSMFNDRFRVQTSDAPSTTITSHIAKDGHYFIHYSAEQCRSLTVREAARLQTFPDNYFFCGGRTDQYHQVGNAVPPLLALQIARSVFELLRRAK